MECILGCTAVFSSIAKHEIEAKILFRGSEKSYFPLFLQQKLEAKLTGNKLSDAKQSKRIEKLLDQENAEGRFMLVSVPIY
jgi:hypothetical protein